MGVAAGVYFEQLVTRGHGYPLWEPEPTEAGEVLIGDVGYVYDGCFYRLFNITLPADHKINIGGVPSGFAPLKINKRLLAVRDHYIDAGPLCSRSVRSYAIEGHGGADIVATGGAYKFVCSRDQGALLVLKDDAKKEAVIPNRSFVDYMLANHESWYEYLQEELKVDIPREDIVLVRGWVKTRQWAVAAFIDRGQMHEVSFNGQFGQVAQAGFKVAVAQQSSMSVETRSGPRRATPAIESDTSGKGKEPETPDLTPSVPVDQCVFLSHYKIKYRRFWPGKKVTAGAGPDTLPEDSPNPGASGSVVETDAPAQKLHDPLDDVLNYILSHSDAEVAITSDGDVEELLDAQEWPENMTQYLEDHLPAISVDDNKTGILSLEAAILRAHTAAAAALAAEEAERERQITAQAVQASMDQQKAEAAGDEPMDQDAPVAGPSGTAQTDDAGGEAGPSGEAGEAPAEEAVAADKDAAPVVAVEGEQPAAAPEKSEVPEATSSTEATATPETTATATDDTPAVTTDEAPTADETEQPTDGNNAEQTGEDDTDQNGGINVPPPDDDDDDNALVTRAEVFDSDEGKSAPETLRGGAIILGKWAQEGRSMDWPHRLLLDSQSEGGATCSLSVTNHYIAAGFEDCRVRVWRMADGLLLHRLTRHEDTVWATAFSPNGSQLVSGGADSKLMIWNTYTGQFVKELVGHEGDIWTVAWSPDGNSIVSGSVDCTIRIWDANSGQLRATCAGHSAVVIYTTFSPDGKTVISAADSTARVWDALSGQLISELNGHTGVIWCLAYSQDSLRVVTGSEDNTSRVWSAESGEELVTLREHTGPIWAVGFGPDGKSVATGSYDSTIAVCNSYTGDRHHLFRERPSIVNTVAYSADGDYVASGCADGSVKLWDAVDGAFVAEMQGHKDKVKAVAFSPDDQNVVSSSDDGTVRIWNILDILRVSPA